MCDAGEDDNETTPSLADASLLVLFLFPKLAMPLSSKFHPSGVLRGRMARCLCLTLRSLPSPEL